MNKDDLTHNSFEEQWQKAFDDASMTPPEALWDKIELGLDKNIPPKSGNGTYYLGVLTALILSMTLWYFIKKDNEETPLQVIESKPTIVTKKEVALPQTSIEATFKSEKIVVEKQIKNIEKEEEIIEPQIVENQSEEIKRIVTDSVNFITPISPKQIPLNFTTTTPELIIEQTPYYEKPKPKSKKNSIFKNVRISGGIGVYQ